MQGKRAQGNMLTKFEGLFLAAWCTLVGGHLLLLSVDSGEAEKHVLYGRKTGVDCCARTRGVYV
jgi:hypothetical protein